MKALFLVCDCIVESLLSSGGQCERDLDECAAFKPCRNGAACIDRLNGFECVCKAGWTGKLASLCFRLIINIGLTVDRVLCP